ncbi:glycerate kinase [Geobacter sp. SVR]|uniref:glycerate kinase n=1 Tax=Geobacter sp. SVR TaxID=2495594 RepID=UPI00143F02DA|nr:glycerate kinase [Geobacter sp. SVR]BCS52579.1 glycerate kinase [Geobacter sp. SVR]GCF83983.1 glycerate kinase [Geobacter sp. SVR]
MKIVIAPDSFKESLSALEAAEQIAAGFREVFPDGEYVLVPLADGGEGTVQAMVAATGGRIVPVDATGPLGTAVPAFYGLTGDGRTAVIEMAAASGLTLVPPARRNPLLTTTYGTGELIRSALAEGVSRIIAGIGGSATNDGGAGMLQALGMKLLDAQGDEIGFGGGALAGLAGIDAGGLVRGVREVRIEVACDVDNPLLGVRGASAVFGPQKGATPDMVAQLDANLAHYAAVISRDLGVEVATRPGAGAAGGMGAALLALGGRLRPGIDIVLDAVGFEAIARDADLIITGEGRIDGQTAGGKAPLGVARIASRLGKPLIGIAGSLGSDAEGIYAHGIDALFSAVPRPCSLENALADAASNLRTAARNIAATIRLGCRLART